jgi:hypothetical protein
MNSETNNCRKILNDDVSRMTQETCCSIARISVSQSQPPENGSPLELNLTIQFLPSDNAVGVYYKDKLLYVYRKNRLTMNLHCEKRKKYSHTFTVW